LGLEYLHQNPSGQDEFPRRLECCHFNKDVFYSTFTHVISVLSHLGKGLDIDQRRGLWLASVFGNNPIHFWEFGQLCAKDDVQVEFRKLEGWQIASAFLSFLIGTRKLVKLLQRWRPCAKSTKPSARAKGASRRQAKGASRQAKAAKDAHPVLTKAAPTGEDKVLTESMAMELLEQLETNDWQNLDDVPQFCRLPGYKKAFVAFLMKYCKKWPGLPVAQRVLDGSRHQPHLNGTSDSSHMKASIQCLERISDELWSVDNTHVTKNKYLGVYKQLTEPSTAKTPGCLGCGDLTSQHLLSIGVLAGFLPRSVATYAVIGKDTKAWKDVLRPRLIQQHKELGRDEKAVDKNHLDYSWGILGGIAHVLKISLRTAENLVCEWGRVLRKRPIPPDLIFPGQSLFEWRQHMTGSKRTDLILKYMLARPEPVLVPLSCPVTALTATTPARTPVRTPPTSLKRRPEGPSPARTRRPKRPKTAEHSPRLKPPNPLRTRKSLDIRVWIGKFHPDLERPHVGLSRGVLQLTSKGKALLHEYNIRSKKGTKSFPQAPAPRQAFSYSMHWKDLIFTPAIGTPFQEIFLRSGCWSDGSRLYFSSKENAYEFVMFSALFDKRFRSAFLDMFIPFYFGNEDERSQRVLPHTVQVELKGCAEYKGNSHTLELVMIEEEDKFSFRFMVTGLYLQNEVLCIPKIIE
jgi:hypothetical protein